jgi:hypothetical protein
MQRTIARIRPLAPAFAAVVASVLVSLVVLRPPAERLLPGAAPADRGHVGALVLPAPRVSRPAARPQRVSSPAAPVRSVPTSRALRPPAAAASLVHPKPSPKPAPKPKPKTTATPAAPTPPALPAVPATPPAPPQPVALVRHGHGPPAHSHSRLLATPKAKPAKPPKPAKPTNPPKPPKPPKPAPPAPVQPPPPHGHAGAPPGQNKAKGSPHH